MDDNATIKVSRVSTGMGITDEKQFTVSSNYQETLRRTETESWMVLERCAHGNTHLVRAE